MILDIINVIIIKILYKYIVIILIKCNYLCIIYRIIIRNNTLYVIDIIMCTYYITSMFIMSITNVQY